jgi:integrase
MSTLTVNKSGYLIQWYMDGRRYSIYLSGHRYTKEYAEEFRQIVERLLLYRWRNDTVFDKKTMVWLETAPPELLSKLAKVGLITRDKPKTCQLLWDTFLKYKKGTVKSNTMKDYSINQKIFYQTFAPTDLIEDVTPERLQTWKVSLLRSGRAAAGVASILKTTQTVFNWAVAQEWLPKSPMKNISLGSFINRENDRIISIAEYAQLLSACPTQEYRVILAFARIGGLRCPSELEQMRWSDIDWERNRFLVRSPKTERHVGHQEREVPLFHELRQELEKLRSQVKPKDNDFVIQSFQGSSWNLYDPFQKIARAAGLGKIIRPFDNMRMSRSNEVIREYDEIKESLWIGHTRKVMLEHYYQLSDEDFAEAAKADR